MKHIIGSVVTNVSKSAVKHVAENDAKSVVEHVSILSDGRDMEVRGKCRTHLVKHLHV